MQQLISALQEVLGPGGVLTGEAARSRSGSWGVMHCDAPAVLRPRVHRRRWRPYCGSATPPARRW